MSVPLPPGDATSSALPARRPLDRAAVERVLARATELQVAMPEGGGLLTEEQLLELGQEVGLAPEALRQALAEERTRTVVPVESGMAARLFGPRSASASRTVRGTAPQVMGLLDGWMQRDECLRPKRRFTDRATWEPRDDFFGSLRRNLNLGGRGYALMRAREVAATVVPVDERRVLVRLDADLASSRQARVRVSGTAAAAGVVTGGALAAVASLVVVPGAIAVAAVAVLAAAPAIAGLGGAYAAARGHAAVVERTQLALEQLLDRLEHEPGRGATPLIGRLF
jgi:hypothetical protein